MYSEVLKRVSAERIQHDLRFLCHNPLQFRTVRHTRLGQKVNTLAEADAFIQKQLESAGYTVNSTSHRVQAFRCDTSKPLHHWYAAPGPEDPWYEVQNLEIELSGRAYPGEIIQLVAHKDSMSWIDSPGAHDNAVGTAANMELARLLATVDTKRTIRVLFCNEEHTPWTSRATAEAAAARGDSIIAVLNQDLLDGKSDEDMAAGRLTHVVVYSTEEGRPLAEFIAGCAVRHGIDLEVRTCFKDHVNDDDGMFIEAGFRAAVMNAGSYPYADTHYHLPGDVAGRVNITNVVLSTRLLLAAILEIDACGADAFRPG